MRAFICFTFLSIFLSGCPPIDPLDESFEPETSAYYPILIDRETANNQIGVVSPKTVELAGKFYIYKNYILLIEQGEGIHVYDNTDITNPINIAFINIMNISDVAVSNDVLYVNQSVDLVALDISNVNNVVITSRLKNVSSDVAPDGLTIKEKYLVNRPENTIVARWELISTINQ